MIPPRRISGSFVQKEIIPPRSRPLVRQGLYGAALASGVQLANMAYRKYKGNKSGVIRTPVIQQTGKNTATIKSIKIRKPKKRTMKARLRALEKKTKDELSVVVYKVDTKDVLRPPSGTAYYGYASGVLISNIEAALAQARFFDPSTPGTLITASLASPTYKQNVMIRVVSGIIFKNNYQVPCKITYGVVKPKVATSITPNAAFQNGLVDLGNPDNSSTLLTYKDSDEFKESWKGKLYNKILMPGQQCSLKYKQKSFQYDPSWTDSHTETFQPACKSTVFVYRCQGVLAHDSAVASEQGISGAGFDVYAYSVYYVYYNSGGAAVKTVVLSEGATQTFTNGAVQSQIVVDNQGYSLA